jgi:hypothetical protein
MQSANKENNHPLSQSYSNLGVKFSAGNKLVYRDSQTVNDFCTSSQLITNFDDNTEFAELSHNIETEIS